MGISLISISLILIVDLEDFAFMLPRFCFNLLYYFKLTIIIVHVHAYN